MTIFLTQEILCAILHENVADTCKLLWISSGSMKSLWVSVNAFFELG